ncbi:hypothetical protein [Corynebacterium variabile]|uniref:hypothetical protein n=1 Tax=Corynebacterium variabile TaxID=1727 RepID=UPI003A94B3BA
MSKVEYCASNLLNDVSWGDFPTWLATIGTVGALMAVIFQLQRDKEWRAGEIKANKEKERRSQAEKISSWIDSGQSGTRIVVSNSSNSPIYDVVAFLTTSTEERVATNHNDDTSNHGEKKKMYITVHVLPPGNWRIDACDGWRGMSKHAYSEVSFTDTLGSHWVRRANGRIDELQENGLVSTHLGFPYNEHLFALFDPATRG